jgi:tetratricopeptide (TPR) repeat protein
VELTLWPHALAVFHPYPANSHPGWAIVAALALVAATVGALALFRRAPWVTTGWLWYAGMLVPVAGILQTGHQAYADRFTYAPGIGLTIAFVWSAAAAVGQHRSRQIVGAIVAMIALTACGVATARQVTVWRDTQTLFERVLAVAGNNPVGARAAHRKIGQALIEKGRVADAMPHLERGFGFSLGYESELRRQLAANAEDIETRRTLAATLVRETRVEEGIAEYRAILVRDSTDADACTNIAWIRATHPLALHRDGNEAVRLAERARDVCPEPMAVVYSTLAAAYAEAGRYSDAVQAGTRAVDLARAAGAGDEADRYAEQLAFYKSGKPFHFMD